MGWTWHRASHYYPNEGQYEILKSTMVGGVYYAAVRKLKQYCGENADGKNQGNSRFPARTG